MKGLTPYNMKIVAEVLSGSSYQFSLLELLGSKPVIVDCGANIGSFSLACKTQIADCQIIAVEPDKNLFAALTDNLRDYDSVTLIQAALTDRNGTISLMNGKNDGVANSIFKGEMVLENSSTIVESKATLDFLTNIKQRYQRIDVLKMDTEGAEWYLLDLPEDILADVGLIYMEYHSADFFPLFCHKLHTTHVIHNAKIRFPHRGEVAWIRKDLITAEQKTYEIRPQQ
ncbi:MAG: FkbM family methyltransferase [Undibacterium sp.]|nr:FkbM family methyltransferase [Undibacterium sp.]